MKKYEYTYKEPKKPERRKFSYEFNQERTGMNKNLLIAFVALVVIDIIFYYLGFDAIYRVLRAVLGLVFVLFIPGYIATFAFFKDEIDEIERLALSIGLSISLVVLTVMFSNLALKIPINFQTIVFEILAICGAFYGLSRMPAIKVPKRTTYILMGGGLILFIFLLDIFYPYLVSNAIEEENSMQKFSLEELYSNRMDVQRYYPQKGIAETITNVTIPPTSVVIFDSKIALLSHSIKNATVSVGNSLHIDYYWMSVNETDKEYTVTVDITDAAGKIIFKQDHKLLRLNKGDVLMEEYDVRVPAINEGTYLVRVGLFNASVTSGSFIDSQNRAVINTLKVIKQVLIFSDLYNESMLVKRYYPQKKIAQLTSEIKIQNPVVVNFNNSIALLGYSINKTNLKSGESFHIIYYWKSLDKVDINYTVFVHITNATGSMGFQQDHGLPLKTSLWRKGDVIAEEYDVKVPNVAAGNYTIRLGLYDSSGTKKRMPILFGPMDKENRAIIETFNITQ
ncbi:MAG: DUF1616 domain-containing protein [Nanoarchaeota archaeon]